MTSPDHKHTRAKLLERYIMSNSQQPKQVEQPQQLEQAKQPKQFEQLKKTDITRPELWDFPMDYPIRIIGLACDALHADVKAILAIHVPEFDLAALEHTPSRTGKYHSIRANLPLTSEAQVNQLYAALAAADTIKTVL